MIKHMTNQRIAVATIVLLTAVGGIVASVEAFSPNRDGYVSTQADPADVPERLDGGRASVRSAGKAGASAVPGDEQISVLSSPRETHDQVPQSVAAVAHDGVVDFSQARRAEPKAGNPVWIAPGVSGNTACLIAPGELACPEAAHVVQRGVSVATFWHVDTPVRVTGIAADFVKMVTVVTASGARAEIPVVDNTFLYESAQTPRAVEWVTPDGVARTPIEVP